MDVPAERFDKRIYDSVTHDSTNEDNNAQRAPGLWRSAAVAACAKISRPRVSLKTLTWFSRERERKRALSEDRRSDSTRGGNDSARVEVIYVMNSVRS